MYSDPNLDAPPPTSQFRRPWSPEGYDTHGSGNNSYNTRWNDAQYYVQSDQGHLGGSAPHRQQRREASDVSVEALDLADYARTLRTRQAEDAYPAFPPSQVRQPQAHYPPSSFPSVPQLARHSDSGLQPPSLISRGPTLSSEGTHYTSSSARPAHRRPFSLPATPRNSSQGSSSRVRLEHPSHRGPPYIVDPNANFSSDEIDISNFPKWSRGWYNTNNSATRQPEADIYTPLPYSRLDSTKKQSPFDPGYVHDPYGTYNSADPYSPYDPPLSSMGGDSRDVLPWSNDPPEYGLPLDPMLREERMRMLEREFGNTGKRKSKDLSKSLLDEDGKPVIGTVDEKGNLVTAGPKRRIIFRTLQVILAIGACVPAIYAAVAIKAVDPRFPPPPANKPAAFVLYILSSITLLILLYMFVIRPCCCVRKRKPSSKNPLDMGMMVLPVGGPPGKKKKKPKGGKKGKGKYGPAPPGDVQVNLIVDPKAFQRPGDDESDSEDDELDSAEEGMMPGGYDDRERAARRKKRNKNRRRRGVFEGLKMEEEWKVARRWAKKVAAVDVLGLVLWGAAFVFIIIGKRCPSGEFNGWCNAYNVSTACACLLAFAFGVTTFFDVQDLHSSKQSPRTRS